MWVLLTLIAAGGFAICIGGYLLPYATVQFCTDSIMKLNTSYLDAHLSPDQWEQIQLFGMDAFKRNLTRECPAQSYKNTLSSKGLVLGGILFEAALGVEVFATTRRKTEP